MGDPTKPLGIELCYHARVLLCFDGKTRLLITCFVSMERQGY